MLDYDKLQGAIKDLGKISDNELFLRGLLKAYDLPDASYVRATQNSSINSGLYISNKLYFLSSSASSPYADFNILNRNGFQNIRARFIVVANKDEIVATDIQTGNTLSSTKLELYRYVDFFYPLAGIEISEETEQQSVNVKVSSKFAELSNNLKLLNYANADITNTLQEFIVRLLFVCFTNSFGLLTDEKSLSVCINTYVGSSPDSMDKYLREVFYAIGHRDRQGLPGHLEHIKFIDGRLFQEVLPPISMDMTTRKLILEIIAFDWADVDADILGATIQAMFDSNEDNLCLNYTSSANIRKLLGPLFIDKLYAQLDEAGTDFSKCKQLWNRINNIRIFDPSCNAGNFLILAYRELVKIQSKLRNVFAAHSICVDGAVTPFSFFGVDQSAFSCSIARLAFVFTSCQLNRELNSSLFDQAFSVALDYCFANNIRVADSIRTKWENVFPPQGEMYIVGNTQYRGARRQSDAQRSNMEYVFGAFTGYRNLDYSACWFYLGAQYVKQHGGAYAFVTTNSITQGEQASFLWPIIFQNDVHISFAYTSFKWRNSARNQSAVTVVIVGVVPNSNTQPCLLFSDGILREVPAITGNLQRGTIMIQSRSSSISGFPEMIKGNMPYGEALFIKTRSEHDELIRRSPAAATFVKRVVGSKEFIHNNDRWGIWVTDATAAEALLIPAVKKYVDAQLECRRALKQVPEKLLSKPYRFREENETHSTSLVVPAVSGENYEYLPIGFVGPDTIVTNLAFVVYDCEPWIFGVVASKMHKLWIRAVCGQHETRTRYSNEMGYNTFPFPNITLEQKRAIKRCVFGVIQARENHPELNLASLYKHDEMPEDLSIAHSILDATIERCYRENAFSSDEERLDCLFNLYKEMTAR